VLDETALCHVGLIDRDRPIVVPTLHVRVGDVVYLHGSPATRLFRSMKAGAMVCLTATILDGWVLARSAFHHSANYRSVVVFGQVEVVTDIERRRAALDALTDRIAPGRRETLRPMTDKEVRGTAVVSIPIVEASAKVRTGPPVDDEADYSLPIWAGVVPVTTSYGAPVPDPLLHPAANLPDHLGFFTS
jgi:nitroimidazol reductase NimA-like FMN-containing flavoprotein (pyridoxamine 5'-phosphate oxidase superfamily)